MTDENGENSTSKAIRERYGRILGLDYVSRTPAAQKSRLRLRWFILLLSFAALIGAWLLFVFAPRINSNPPQLRLSPDHQERPGRPEPELRLGPDAGSTAADRPVPAPQGLPHDPINAPREQRPGGSPAPEPGGEYAQPAPPGRFLVVLLSTLSKAEAIERAAKLNAEGYVSEVILSSTGYYGVVLRHSTYAQAEVSMKEAAAVAAGKKPYIMNADRVKESVYPVPK
jgi:hypothetical protein